MAGSLLVYLYSVFFCKQKTAYEMRISDWSSDVCSSDLQVDAPTIQGARWTGAARLPHKLRRWRIAVAPPEQRIHPISINLHIQIGRASCRVRVCQYV